MTSTGTDDDDAAGFAPPPFDAAAALPVLQRALRDLKLAERGAAFELRGKRVVELQLDGNAIRARVARKLALTPEWDTLRVDSAVQQRKLIVDVGKRLARWNSDD